MAQGHLAGERSYGLAESQRLEIQQYESIVGFQAIVLAGTHPTIKPPSHLIAPKQSPKQAQDVAAKPSHAARPLDNSQSFSANARQPPQKPIAATQFITGNTEINPILLEKSESLIRAEIHLKRQRLERALREDVEQHRVAAKSVAQGDSLADFDLNDILSKALTLVEATTAPSPAGENVGATNHETSSDSFDDNTFYSSRHDTPESALISRVRNESEDARMPDVSNSQQVPSVRDEPLKLEQPPPISHPTPNSQVDVRVISSGSSQNASTRHSQSDEAGNKDADQQERTSRSKPAQQARDPHLDKHPPSPLIRTHGPHTLQSSYASPLTAPRRPVVIIDQGSSSSTGTPQQVAALRTELGAGTSPESSPQGGKQLDKKRARKKKRKADRQAPEAEAAYIKREPQSASPMNAPSYTRSSKRPRQQQANEAGYEEVRYEPPASSAVHEVYPPYVPRDDRIPVGYERAGVYPRRAASAAVAGPVYGGEYAQERYVPGAPYVVGQSSSHHDSLPRSNPQVVPAEGYPRYSSSGYRNYEASPMSVRREGEAFIAPPRPPPTRIIVDAFGREYIEPPRSSVRHSVAPPARSDEPEIIYERAAPGSVSRHGGGVDSYEQGGTIYRRSSPSYLPRRIVTQPDYVSQDYRDNRLREYPGRPMVSSNEFVEVMVPPERRRVEEGSREYISRASSVRPAEPVRYEIPRDYGRVEGTRAEAPIRQYATSAHSDGRREAQPYMREYGSRPVEATVMRRDYGAARPAVERYYDQQPVRGEEIAFIERPRGATQDIVYADDARREVYR